MTNSVNPQFPASAHDGSSPHAEAGTIFDDTVHLAATLCGAPVGLIATHDKGRVSFQAVYRETADGAFDGVASESPFWAFVSQQPEPLVIADLSKDARFHDDPMVSGAHGMRFYAGVPLHNSSGEAAGALVVLDVVPRTLHPSRLTGLLLLAHQLETQLHLHEERDHLIAVLAERQRTESELRSSSALFRVFMDNSPLISYMKDQAGRMIYYNRRFAERFSIDQEVWLGKDDFELWPSEFAAAFRATDLGVLAGGKLVVTEEVSPGDGAEPIHWRTYKFPFTDAFGEQFIAGMSLDISFEKKAAEEMARSNAELQALAHQLAELSHRDALTGLRNRRAFEERLSHEFALAKRHALPISVLLLDVDHFKAINDSFGHERGDSVLRQIGTIMQQVARTTDLVCRYGGEEFAVLLPNTPLESAVRLGNRIRLAVEQAPWPEENKVTVSAGTATNSSDVLDIATLVRQADTALYEAKTAGRNRVLVYNVPE